MGREPVMDEGKPKFSLLHRFGNEFVGRERFNINEIAVGSQHGVRHYKTDSLVAINEGVIVREGFHQGGSFLDYAAVVAGLGSHYGCFQQPLVSQALGAAELFNQNPVGLDRLRDGRVDAPRHLLRQ